MSMPNNIANSDISATAGSSNSSENHQLTTYDPAIPLSQQSKVTKPSSSKNNKAKTKPAFVLKLWTMVNDQKNHDLIDWSEDGESFVVKNRELFVSKILPKFFKHSNFASFVRQLNMYGWHKVQDIQNGSLHNDERWQFTNLNFHKDKPDLLDNIVRNKQENQTGIPGGATAEDFDVSGLIGELNTLKSNQLKISKELQRVHQDNEMLWQELLSSREKNKVQNDKIERILQFLASVYGSKAKALEDQIHQQIEDIQYNGSVSHQQATARNPTMDLHHHPRVQEYNGDEFVQPMTPKPRLMIQNRPSSSTRSSPIEVIATPGSYTSTQGIGPQSIQQIPQGGQQQLPPHVQQFQPQPLNQFIPQPSPISQQSIPITPQYTNNEGFSPLSAQQIPMQTHIPPPPPQSQSLPNLDQANIHNTQQHPIASPSTASTSNIIPQVQFPQPGPPPPTTPQNVSNIPQQATRQPAHSQQGQEPPFKRPKIQTQPSIDDLSRTIEQQGHSINDIITRINSQQPETNYSSNFDLDDFLNDNEALIGVDDHDDLIHKVGSIEEIYDDTR